MTAHSVSKKLKTQQLYIVTKLELQKEQQCILLRLGFEVLMAMGENFAISGYGSFPYQQDHFNIEF